MYILYIYLSLFEKNPCPGLQQAQQYSGINPVNMIPMMNGYYGLRIILTK
jgi:hypothetical protein